MARGNCGRRGSSGSAGGVSAVARVQREGTEDVIMCRHVKGTTDSAFCVVERQLCQLNQALNHQNRMLEELLREVQGQRT